MRILFVTPSLGTGGAERLTVNSALGMQHRATRSASNYGYLSLQAGPLRDAGVELYKRPGGPPGTREPPPWARHVRPGGPRLSSRRHLRAVGRDGAGGTAWSHRVPLLVTVHGISHTDERLASHPVPGRRV